VEAVISEGPERIADLRDLLLRNHVIEEDIPIDFPPGLLESGQAGTFLAARFPRQT